MAQKLLSPIILSSSSEMSSSSFRISRNFSRICWSKLSTLCWYCWLMSVSLSNSFSFSCCRLSSSFRRRDILKLSVLLCFLAASGTANWSAPSPSWNFIVLEVQQSSRGLSLSYFWNCQPASAGLCHFCWRRREWGRLQLISEVLLLMEESMGFWLLAAKVLPLTLRRYFPQELCRYSFQKSWWMLRMFLALATLICSCDFFLIRISLNSSLAMVEDCSPTFCLQFQSCLSRNCILWLSFSPELLRASP